MEQTGKHYFIETFGCQMNVRDSETLAGILEENGYMRAVTKAEADVILYNTCCVREHAEKRVFGNIGALRDWKEENPARILIVCGCMMQQKAVAERLFRRFPYVDIVCGTNLLHRFAAYLEEARVGNRVLAVEEGSICIEDDLPVVRSGGGINAFVNINYGCNNFCTYCIVPYVRGRERSRMPEAILSEVRALADSGFTEITLLGQNVNSYGNDLAEMDFAQLLRMVSEVPGLKRIRYMTSHPKDLSDKLIAAMASLPNVCHHVHLPLQSGSNRILKAMNRRYTREAYCEIVDKLRAAMPDVEITTDIIVGFPGETEADFSDTLEMVARIGFAAAFTFMYSVRTGTVAASMPEQIAQQTKKERLQRLNALQAEKSYENNEKYIGVSGLVHVEGCDTRKKPMCYGKFANFKMLYFPATPELIGSYVPVRAVRVRQNSLIGEMEE